uniref:Uncharacterized protein n=1 Tax=Arundo donax TaxID=35708 RepID=A0A0A9SUA1_ARUDO
MSKQGWTKKKDRYPNHTLVIQISWPISLTFSSTCQVRAVFFHLRPGVCVSPFLFSLSFLVSVCFFSLYGLLFLL